MDIYGLEQVQESIGTIQIKTGLTHAPLDRLWRGESGRFLQLLVSNL